jgi:hypothetical protein
MNKIKESNTEIAELKRFSQDLVKWLEKVGCTKAETKAIKKNALDALTRPFGMSSKEEK